MATLVHDIETTVNYARNLTYRDYQAQKIGSEYHLSRRIYELIDDLNGSDRTWTFDSCRSQAWFVRNSESGEVRVSSNHCNLRWCPLCAKSKSYTYAMNSLPWLKSLNRPKFLTLTFKHSSEPLADQINSIYDAFKRLRKKKSFKDYVSGGIWFFQVKKTTKTQEWHPHLHCVIDSKYFPQKQLVELWRSVTADSFVVDIRAVRSVRNVFNYVARYVARPMSLSGLTDSEMMELFKSFHGRRLCGSFGTAKSVSFSVEPLSSSGTWRTVGSWSTVVNLAGIDTSATLIFDSWITGEPLGSDVSMAETERLIYGSEPEPPPKPSPDPQFVIDY